MDATAPDKIIYWHRELPPPGAEALGSHVLEAVSMRVRGRLDRHGELWEQCHADLMQRLRERLLQEAARLGGRYVHVLEEVIDSRRDEATGETWLHGRVSYVLLGPVPTGPP